MTKKHIVLVVILVLFNLLPAISQSNSELDVLLDYSSLSNNQIEQNEYSAIKYTDRVGSTVGYIISKDRGISIFPLINKSNENISRPTDTEDEMRVIASGDSARKLIVERRYSEAMDVLQRGLTLAYVINFERGISDLYRTTGTIHYLKGEYNEAIEMFNASINICMKLGEMECLARNYYNLSLVYRYQGRLYESFEAIRRAILIWEEIGNTENIIAGYKISLIILTYISDTQHAIESAEKAVEHSKMIGDRHNEADIYDLIGSVYKGLGEIDSVYKYYNKSAEIYKTLGENLQYARVMHNLAISGYYKNNSDVVKILNELIRVYEENNPKSSALSTIYINLGLRSNYDRDKLRYYKNAIEYARASNSVIHLIDAYYYLGNYYFSKSELNDADRIFTTALDLITGRGLKQKKSEILHILSDINFEKSKYSVAIKYLRQAYAINDSIKTETEKFNIQQVTAQYTFEQSLFEARAQIAAQKQELLYRKYIIYIVVIAVVIVLFLLFMIRNTNKKLLNLNDELIKLKDSLEDRVTEQTNHLIKARMKAEEANQLKSSFLTNMSHEIRTPMNGILGFLDFIDSNHIDPETRKEYSRIVRSSTQQLLQLINDIVDVAKIESNSLSINHTEFDINIILQEMELSFNSFIKTKDKRLEVVFDTSNSIYPCIIDSDVTRVRQILNNVIGNAVKFTESGYVKFGYEIESDMLVFTVEDTGIGIPEDKLKIIFDRFNQINAQDRIRYGGTGMGLYITKQIVEMLGGSITVQSELGYGTHLVFRIPIRKM